MAQNLQVVDEASFVGYLVAAEPLLLYGYSGRIPFNPTDELDEHDNIRLASRNGPISYDPTTHALKFRLTVLESGNITFIRVFNSEGVLLAQAFPADYAPIVATVGKIIRLDIPEVYFALRPDSEE